MYTSLQLANFRSYPEYAVEFEPGVNIIVGPNGSGKTNLLEALYVISTGSSFRAVDRDMLRHDEGWYRIEARYGDQQRILTYRNVDETIEKQFTLDGTKKARLTHQQRVPVVLFEPDHLRLLRESPTLRRDYLDNLLIRMQPDYAWLKHQFDRVLTQRNAMLKRRLSPAQLEDQLFVWDIKFVELAEQVVARRRDLVAKLNANLTEVYSIIARRPHTAVIRYVSSVPGEDYHANLLKQLHDRLPRDVERGFTGIGPQRDDFDITLDDAPAAVSASRGEVRSLLLSLKMIEVKLLAAQYDQSPLLLFDDVFSELDASRRQALAELAKTYQTLITTTDADAIIEHFLDGYNIIATSYNGSAGS
jgi:DNA replication and repair protein RecF